MRRSGSDGFWTVDNLENETSAGPLVGLDLRIFRFVRDK
jgi:hypothetical protein